MKRCLAMMLLLLMLLPLVAGCKEEPPPPPPPPPMPPPPPPTPEEIEAEIMEGVNAMFTMIWNADGITTQEAKDELTGRLKQAVQKHQGTDWGRRGTTRVANFFERKIKEAYDKQKYDLTFFVCDILEAMQPDNTVMKRYREMAYDQKTRPVVNITGVYAQDGETIWFMDVFLPATGRTENVRVREGEEFHGLRFVRTIGANSGVELEYQKLHELFTVMRRS